MKQAAALALAISLASAGCAANAAREEPQTGGQDTNPVIVGTGDFSDPLIGVNRAIFTFNDVTYRYLLVPLAKGYRWVMPDPVETGISNFFHNLKTPIYLVNDILQLEPAPLGKHLSRFVINSTVGLLGFFDPAEAWFGLPRSDTGFEDTLAGYGAGYGIYLVLPILGPSDTRNATGQLADHFLHPVPYLTDEPQTSYLLAYEGFHDFSPRAEPYEALRGQVDDPYIFFRNLYLQGVQRDARP